MQFYCSVSVVFLLISDSTADLGLSMFVWEALCHGSVNVANKRCFLAIFDMNRWYNAQMPSCIRSGFHFVWWSV